MIRKKTKYILKTKYSLLQEFTNADKLKDFFFHDIVETVGGMGAFVTISSIRIVDDVIMGEIESSDNFKNIFPKLFFQIHLETKANLETKAILITSDDSFSFTTKYKKQKQKQIKNYNKLQQLSLLVLLSC